MIVEYDINCYERTLKIDITEWWWNMIEGWREDFKDYLFTKEMPEYIQNILDQYYSHWNNSEDSEVYQIPLEEYMMMRFEEDYGKLWTHWESVDWDVE